MESFFIFRGSRIQYRIRGKGRAIVLVHGFLGSKDLWIAQESDLSKKYKTISIDLPGHGDSESLGYIHSMEIMADLIHALLKKLKIRKIILIGHSMGGYVSLAYAEKYTDSLNALILVNSTASRDSKSRLSSRKQLINLLPKKRLILLQGLIESFFVVEGRNRRYGVAKYLRWAKKCDPKGIVASVRGMMERKEREIILKFAPYPYCIIAGIQDPIVPIKQNRTEVKLNSNACLVELEDSGHISPLEKPWKLNSEILSFLSAIDLN